MHWNPRFEPVQRQDYAPIFSSFFSGLWPSRFCNNSLVNSNSREEDEDREQRMNTTLKKDVVQTTSTNNSTPITPFYMQLRAITCYTTPSTAKHNPKCYQDISGREQ